MKKYFPTIGLEIHAELDTETKMFCQSKNDPDETRPNVNICPVCTAQPGTLPVINKKAVEHMIRIGSAVGGKIADFTEFDRKNYFYPDIPKGYQISQYKHPIVSGGELAGVELTRIHLEEDTGTNKHEDDHSLVDYNRAGVPLMELVTEPVIHNAEDAMKFGKELQLLLRYLGTSRANMEKGEMRVEANVSVSDDPNKLSPNYVELKNINSFGNMARAVEYEIKRMTELLEEGRGEEIIRETRGWDEVKQATFSQRKKEGSADYRYFPDPDLPKLKLHSEFDIEKLKSELPELPWEKRERYKNDYGIKDEDIESFISDIPLGTFFEEVVSKLGDDKEKVKLASNYITSDLVGLMKDNEKAKLPDSESFAKLISMSKDGSVNSRGVKDILAILAVEGGDPETIANEKGLIQKNDPEELKKVAQSIVDANPNSVEDYKAGKEVALKFLMGQVMRETRGSANPKVAEELLKELLK